MKCKPLVSRLKTIDVVIRNTKDAEDTLNNYETRLRDVSKVPADDKEVENHRSQLKVLFLLEKMSWCFQFIHICIQCASLNLYLAYWAALLSSPKVYDLDALTSDVTFLSL